MTTDQFQKQLEDWVARMPNKYGIFINGKIAFLSTSNVYSSVGMAKRRLLNINFYNHGVYKMTEEQLKELMDKKVIEIKEL